MTGSAIRRPDASWPSGAAVRSRNLQDIVKLPSQVPAEEVPGLVAGAAVFVLPCAAATNARRAAELIERHR